MSLLTEEDIYYFNEGRAFRLYDVLGAQLRENSVHFAVWAPEASSVSVMGDFNGWSKDADFLSPVGQSGIWQGKICHAKKGAVYKYNIISHHHGRILEKADPFAFCTEASPQTGSVIWDLSYQWNDHEWMTTRGGRQHIDTPISIYELHLGSWRQKPEGHPFFSYDELADQLIPYVKKMGFTHVEFMPVMEHPFGGSWGYHITGYYAPTRRFGEPQQLMRLIDRLHQSGVGVILDWVPSHFAVDAHGLAEFDGTSLYEHADKRQGYHPDWGSHIFNFDRNEVRSFLISNALFWLDKYHVDGLRVDAVASMLYLDYSREEGEWIPNKYGGNENIGAIRFIKELNEAVYKYYPDVQVIAEESTAWHGVSKPVHAGGLGFGFKWDLGWMNDTLRYFHRDSVHRQHHHNELTFRSLYGFSENFILPLSHDEVVHGKGSLIRKMHGDDWQKFANLRCLFSYMYAMPGKKLLFMGGEFAQWNEWDHDASLDWHLLNEDRHSGIQKIVQDLNYLYASEKAFHFDARQEGFVWIDADDPEQSVLSFIRRNPYTEETIICIFNLKPVQRENYLIGVPSFGNWIEIFNSDSQRYGGGNNLNNELISHHGHVRSIRLKLPALSGVFLKKMK